jgi:hypothetical protein
VIALIAFFVTTVLLGGNIGDPLLVEDIAAYVSLAAALSGIAYILLGFVVAQRRGDGT